MQHIAVDLGSRYSQYCIRDSDGEILKEGSTGTALLGSVFSELKSCRVVLEACTEAEAVAEEAERHHHDVRIVPSMLSAWATLPITTTPVAVV